MTTKEAVMTTQEVADRLHELFEHHKWEQAQDELFSAKAQSIEPPTAQGMLSVEGIDNIKKKGEMFQANLEQVHGGYLRGPIVAGNHIAFAIGIDCTMKGRGRSMMEEIAIYEVKDGKVVKEQFFF
jgi:hypothetical protein